MVTIKKCGLALCGLLMGLILTTAWAQTDQEAAVKKLVEPKLGKDAKVNSVTKSPYFGLYEVQAGDDILYTDEKATYLFVGNIIDLKTQKNLTKEKVDKLNSMKIADMPLELAFKQVKGNGKREIAVFEDPNCGYCKKLRKELVKMDNITIYTFMYNILSEDSATKSKNVWCSGDPAKAWNDLMVNGKAPPDAPGACMTNPHKQILELGAKLHIRGTPAIFFKDGSRIAGYVDAAAIDEKLKTMK